MSNFFDKVAAEKQKLHPWMLRYFSHKISGLFKERPVNPTHIFLCICDHFEPLWNKADGDTGLKRVKNWCEGYPKIVAKHRDSDGCMPKYSFFYPIEEYREEYLWLLADLCHNGYGEVEVHLHHDNDTAENLRKSLVNFKETLFKKHGLLSKDKLTGEIKYGFIHGNWALDNSRPDGRWCGVNNELRILQETGCYADFTMPSAPDITQTNKINSIYYAQGVPGKAKSHDRGIDVERGVTGRNGLLMVQGPLMLNWGKRKFGFLPGIENGLLDHSCAFNADRAKLWVGAKIGIKNNPDCLFIKLHAHGCQDKNVESLLKRDLDSLFFCLVGKYNDGKKHRLHYVTAREMVNVIKAMEAGMKGDPGQYRDFAMIKA
jgi:hypothetical protein